MIQAHNLDRELQFRRVSRPVNNVNNPRPECVEPVNPLSAEAPPGSLL
jgi:hypothetical protein